MTFRRRPDNTSRPRRLRTGKRDGVGGCFRNAFRPYIISRSTLFVFFAPATATSACLCEKCLYAPCHSVLEQMGVCSGEHGPLLLNYCRVYVSQPRNPDVENQGQQGGSRSIRNKSDRKRKYVGVLLRVSLLCGHHVRALEDPAVR